MNRSINMTEGNPIRLILLLAVPLILTNLGQQLYGIVDAIIVGRGVGVRAFAALGASDWVNWMVLWSIQGLTQGFSTLVSRNFGAGDMKALKKTVTMCCALCVIIGLSITIISTAAAGPVLKLLGTPDQIFADARTYLTIIYAGSLIVMGYNMAAAILRSVGDGRTPLIAMFAAGGSNVALDIIFVMIFKWGIAGAAAATLLGQLIAFLYCFVIIRKYDFFHMEKDDWRWDGAIVRTLCRLGLPLVLASTTVVIGGIMAQTVINTYGTVFVAGCTAANKLHGTLDCSAVALGYASATYIGQNYGAGRFDRIWKGIKYATVISLIFGTLIMLTMFIFGRPIVGIFLAEDVEDAAEALDIANRYVFVLSAMLNAAYLMNLYRYSLQGLGNTVAPMISGFFELFARAFVAFVFPIFLGSAGLFFMDGSAWAAAGVYQIICFYITLRKKENSLRPQYGY